MGPDKTAQVVISGIVVCAFVGVTVGWMITPPQHEVTQTLALLTGSLASAFGQVVNHWLTNTPGSSNTQ